MTPAATALSIPDQAETPLPLARFWQPVSTGLARHLDLLRDHGMRFRFGRNEAVFSEGEAAVYVFRVAAGCVRLCRHLADGRRSVQDFMLPGDIFGMGDFRYFPYTAEATGPTTVTAYPRALFEQLAEDNQPFQSDLMSHYTRALTRAERHLFVTTCQTARERVASFILEMSQTEQLVYAGRIDLPMGRQDIADHLGLTIETICRSLTALKKAGIIEIPNAHQIDVMNESALRALAEGRNAA